MARIAGQTFSAFETITVSSTAIGLTAGSINGKSIAFLTLETAQIRYRLDGTNPTASVGHILDAGDNLSLDGVGTLANLKMIRVGGSDGTIQASYGS